MKRTIAYLKQWKEVLLLCAFFLVAGGMFAKPYAEQFINQSVDGRIHVLEDKLAKANEALHQQELSGTRVESDLATVRALLKQLLDIELERARTDHP